MRLGHMDKSGPVYSDGDAGPHQPFQYGDDDRYYTQDGRIWCNNKLVIESMGGYSEWTNPWVHNDVMWYEALPEGAQAPMKWEIWKYDLNTKRRKMMFPGANPCVFDGKLYYCKWKERGFEYAICDRLD